MNEILLAQLAALERENKRLRLSESFLDSIIENIPDMIFLKDAKELRFVRFNKAGALILGMDWRSLIGKNDYDFFPKEQADFFTSKDREVLAGGKVVEIPEEPIQTSKGIRYLHTKKIPLFNSEGEAEYLLGISEDITEKKQAEFEHTELEKEQVSNQAKRRFIADISHEIRSPLGVILGYAEMLRRADNFLPEQHEFMRMIVQNGNRLLKIVNELLDLSKIEANKVILESVPFSLSSLFEDVIGSQRLKAEARGINLEVSFADARPDQVGTDPTRVAQVLTNLLDNAIKFTEGGTIHVEVSAKNLCPAARRWEVEVLVTDEGLGIPAERHKRIFEAYEQADDSVTRRFGGTGLGLCVSKQISKLLCGDLTLKWSVPGKGSCFAFKFQATESELESAAGQSADILDSHEFPKKVLVVDDSVDNQKLLQLYLHSMGIECDLASDGREGVKMALENHYDVILMDIQMPVMGGFDAVEILRSKNYRKSVVALTAHAKVGDKENCLAHGFDSYLSKPFTSDSLKKSLRLGAV